MVRAARERGSDEISSACFRARANQKFRGRADPDMVTRALIAATQLRTLVHDLRLAAGVEERHALLAIGDRREELELERPARNQSDQTWIDNWIAALVDGSTTMSQRRLSSVERNGGTEAAIVAAKERGVHLARLTDDEGNVLIAASLHPFEPLC